MFFEIFVALGHIGYLCPTIYCTSIVGFTSTNALEVLTSLQFFFSSPLWVCGLLGWETYQGQSKYMIEDLSRELEKTPIPIVFSDFGLPSF